MEDQLLSIKDLYVRYENDEMTVYAVNGIDLDINRGETVGLVGETGAGKTTTAFAVMGLLPKKIGKVSRGEIVFENINITKATEADMRLLRGNKISMIFQDPMTSLNPVLTVGEQIGEVLELHCKEMDKTERERKVDELMQLVGLPAERKTEYPHQFSGGMKQRIVIAIALACEPELLIADEPTTALDVTIQAQVLDMMTNLKARLGTSIILITHDLGVVAETCDKVAIMYAGEIIEFGSIEDIFEGNRHHPYTLGLFGSIPNMEENLARLKPINGLMPDPCNLPQGCKFHARCPLCMDKCKTEAPQRFEESGHVIYCHLFSGNAKRGV